MEKYKTTFVLGTIFLLMLAGNRLAAQGGNFTAGVVAGLNAAQIDGDGIAGFNKVGLSAGLRGGFPLNKKFHLNVEFLYSERGSRPDLFNNFAAEIVNIAIKYAEIPVYVQLSDWLMDDYYKVRVHAGLSYGRLISANTSDEFEDPLNPIDIDDFAEMFNDNDFSWILGGSYFFSKKMGVTLRYTRYLNNLLNPQKLGFNGNKLRSYFLTFRLEYNF